MGRGVNLLTTCVNDPYELLRVLGRESTCQTLLGDGKRCLDRHELTDGCELWFDVSERLSALNSATEAA